MATGPEHYRKAEELLRIGGSTNVERAQAHATLAQVAATVEQTNVMVNDSNGMLVEWLDVVTLSEPVKVT